MTQTMPTSTQEMPKTTESRFTPEVLELVRQHRGELAATMGIELQDMAPERLHAAMPVAGNRQPLGLLHGGASAVLAETLGSIHAMLLAPEGRSPVGIEISCTHHRSATAGHVHATCEPINIGRTLATFNIVIRDDEDRRCCTSRLTCLYREPRHGTSTDQNPL